jgi:hypothetical protein
LRPRVIEDLVRHGITPRPEDTPASLRGRLNDAYIEDVRRLKQRQVEGALPLRDYAGRVDALKQAYALLGLPLALWEE